MNIILLNHLSVVCTFASKLRYSRHYIFIHSHLLLLFIPLLAFFLILLVPFIPSCILSHVDHLIIAFLMLLSPSLLYCWSIIRIPTSSLHSHFLRKSYVGHIIVLVIIFPTFFILLSYCIPHSTHLLPYFQ